MSRYVLTIALVILSACAALAQEARTSASTNASASAGEAVSLQSGTRIMAQLQSTLDARKARVGDEVLLKTTEAVKSEGRTVVKKGARLVGHVTEVRHSAGAAGESIIGLVFDRLESGALDVPISATITSVTQANARARMHDRDVEAETRARSNTSARTSSRQTSGGLLGGVAGTVGGVVNTTTTAAGDVVGGAGTAVGETVGGVAEGVGRIRISESAGVSAGGGSTLSLSGGNLRLEKGTSFGLRLNQSASVGGDN